jgi:hypothetical protein
MSVWMFLGVKVTLFGIIMLALWDRTGRSNPDEESK